MGEILKNCALYLVTMKRFLFIGRTGLNVKLGTHKIGEKEVSDDV